MEERPIPATDWWKNQKTNYVYVAMAAGILCFLAFASIWETFYSAHKQGDGATAILLSILFLMLWQLAIWVPFIGLEIWAYKFIPRLEAKWNPEGNPEKRMQMLVIACIGVCILPLTLPAILVIVHG